MSCRCGIRHFRHLLPIQLRSLCHSFYEVLNRRFPDEALDALGTVLFLRFINPALGNSATLAASMLAGHPPLFATASNFIGIPANSILVSAAAAVAT